VDLALPGLLIFALLLPGGLFLTVYVLAFREGTKVPVEFPSITGPVALSVPLSLLIHATVAVVVTYVIARPFGLPEPRFDLAFDVLAGQMAGSEKFRDAVEATRNHIPYLIAYLLLVCFAACGLGYAAFLYVRAPKSALGFLSLENRWNYLLDGRYAVFDTIEGNNASEPDATIVSVATEVANRAYVYVGFLQEYSFRPDGSLGTLFLDLAARREFSLDDADADRDFVSTGNWLGDERFVQLGDGTFAVDCSRICNLHVTHVKVSEVEDGDAGGTEGSRGVDVDARSAAGGLEGPRQR
jgi:hypothetical protein